MAENLQLGKKYKLWGFGDRKFTILEVFTEETTTHRQPRLLGGEAKRTTALVEVKETVTRVREMNYDCYEEFEEQVDYSSDLFLEIDEPNSDILKEYAVDYFDTDTLRTLKAVEEVHNLLATGEFQFDTHATDRALYNLKRINEVDI